MPITPSIEPTDRNVDPTKDEWQTAVLNGTGTLRLFTGNGELGNVYNQDASAGATIDFHDVDADDTITTGNRILHAVLDTVGQLFEGRLTLRKGLAIVIGGGAGAEIVTAQIRGYPTVSPRTFGV